MLRLSCGGLLQIGICELVGFGISCSGSGFAGVVVCFGYSLSVLRGCLFDAVHLLDCG